jgi:hypothetical protein
LTLFVNILSLSPLGNTLRISKKLLSLLFESLNARSLYFKDGLKERLAIKSRVLDGKKKESLLAKFRR